MFSEDRFTSLFSKVNIKYCVYLLSILNVALMGYILYGVLTAVSFVLGGD